MPVLPISAPLAVTPAQLHTPNAQQQQLAAMQAGAQTANAQTAKGVRQGAGAGGTKASRDGTKTGESVDNDANAISAKAKRGRKPPSKHELDFEA
ncbi:MAG: hypothetical protein C6Y20_08640 [Tagaea sp. CACIAM 22H2]|jgi:hypothetical protein|nr:hypothetical protein [Tagaea sp. CACIAM 22H2]